MLLKHEDVGNHDATRRRWEPQMHTDEHRYFGEDMELRNLSAERMNELTEKVIGCAFQVANTLGCGFLEKVYEKALAHELRKAGFHVEQQYPITVRYDGVVVGEYVADLFVEGCVIIELKVAKGFDEVMAAQCLNYLKATGIQVCLLFNFGKSRIDVKRYVAGDLK
jgi:GxxExxY protein